MKKRCCLWDASPSKTHAYNCPETSRWLRSLYALHGVGTIPWDEGYALVNVPPKWASLLGDMATAIRSIHAGEGLPELPPASAKPAKKPKAVRP